MENDILIRTQNLSKFFFIKRRKHFLSLVPEHAIVKAVNEISIDVKAGENFAIVGESGSGKTTLGYMLARIFEPTSGNLWLDGKEITYARGRELRELRQKVQMVFQDPGSSLNPRQTVESILSLPFKTYTSLTKGEMKKRIVRLLESVNLPVELMPRYPGVLSGGQTQRISLARALALNPKLLVMDEPTSALDVSVQAKILHLLVDLKKQFGLTYILITHDMSVVKNISKRIAVTYLGRIIELGQIQDVFERPLHPYTKALLSAIPVVKDEEKRILPKEIILQGEIPSPENVPEICPFFSRCQERRKICEESPCPDLKEVEEGHFIRCIL
jgi:peptide/nickel transport system ATP-binding protein